MAKKKKDTSRKNNILPILAFIIGLAIFIYPVISRWYYHIESTRVVADFDAGKDELSEEEINQRIALAAAYNASISGNHELYDPYTASIEEGVENYAHMLAVREKIGVIRIPVIGVEEPVYAGTSEEVLQKGVGHMEMTSLPIGGTSTHAVITGHRGLPHAKIFSELNKMEEGDVFLFENIKETLAYEVDQIKVIEPTVFDDLFVVDGEDYMTLLTCTPYMVNSHRLLIRGHRVPYTPAEIDDFMTEVKSKHGMRNVYYGAVILLAVALLIELIVGRKRRKEKRNKRKGK